MDKLLFLDRDGTLVQEPADFHVNALEKIRLVPFVIPSLLRLRDVGYSFVIVSNQDGLGTPTFPIAPFQLCHEFIVDIFSSQGIDFVDVLICPHFPEDGCACRKPNTAMVESYLDRSNWDRKLSAVVGDRDTDMQLAKNMGIKGMRVHSPFGPGLTWPQIADSLLAIQE